MDVSSESRPDSPTSTEVERPDGNVGFRSPARKSPTPTRARVVPQSTDHLRFGSESDWHHAKTTVQFDCYGKPVLIDVRSKETGDRLAQLNTQEEPLNHSVVMGVDHKAATRGVAPITHHDDMNEQEKAAFIIAMKALNNLRGPPVIMKNITILRPSAAQDKAKTVYMDPDVRQVHYVDAEGNAAVLDLKIGARVSEWILHEMDARALDQEDTMKAKGRANSGAYKHGLFTALTMDGEYTCNTITGNGNCANVFSWTNWTQFCRRLGTIGRFRLIRALDYILRSTKRDRCSTSTVAVTKSGPCVIRVSSKEVQATSNALCNLPSMVAYLQVFCSPTLWAKIPDGTRCKDPHEAVPSFSIDLVPGSAHLVHLRRILHYECFVIANWGYPVAGPDYITAGLLYDAWDVQYCTGFYVPLAKTFCHSNVLEDQEVVWNWDTGTSCKIFDVLDCVSEDPWENFETAWMNRQIADIHGEVMWLTKDEAARKLQERQAKIAAACVTLTGRQDGLGSFIAECGHLLGRLPEYWRASPGKTVPDAAQ